MPTQSNNNLIPFIFVIILGLILAFIPVFIPYEKLEEEAKKMKRRLLNKPIESRRLFTTTESRDLNASLSRYRTKHLKKYPSLLKYITSPVNIKNGVITNFTIDSYKKVLKNGNFPKRKGESKGEALSRVAYMIITGRLIPNVRPEWNRNPLTNCKLEFDGYDEANNFAFEYDGAQHYNYTAECGKAYKDPKTGLMIENTQVYKDTIKSVRARRKGITLFSIPYIVKAENIGTFFHWYLNNKVILTK